MMPGGGFSPTLNTGPTGALKSPCPLIWTSEIDLAFTSQPGGPPEHGGLEQGGQPPWPGGFNKPSCLAISIGTSMFELELISFKVIKNNLSELRFLVFAKSIKYTIFYEQFHF